MGGQGRQHRFWLIRGTDCAPQLLTTCPPSFRQLPTSLLCFKQCVQFKNIYALFQPYIVPCGYGVPNLLSFCWRKRPKLTLSTEKETQPCIWQCVQGPKKLLKFFLDFPRITDFSTNPTIKQVHTLLNLTSVRLQRFYLGGSYQARFQAKNQHTPRKFLQFVTRPSAESTKIGHNFRK